MADVIRTMLREAASLVTRQPALAFALGAALAIFFLTALRSAEPAGDRASLTERLLERGRRVGFGLFTVALLCGVVWCMHSYLDDNLGSYREKHGRVTDVNFRAVRTIWGEEQVQPELEVELTHEKEISERLESEDPTRPALIRKKTETCKIEENPFVSARHRVRLKQNPRKKGSALYAGYETDCRFSYVLRNPANRDVKARLIFPFPSDRPLLDGLAVKRDGQSVLDQLVVEHDDEEGRSRMVSKVQLSAGQSCAHEVAFTSRGLSHWYFQMPKGREIRDFELVLECVDIAKADVNYPEGCAPPASIEPTSDGKGCVLTYRLDRALTDKGFGVAMPALAQPGLAERNILAETPKAWILLFAALLMGLAFAGSRFAAPTAVVLSAALAIGYGVTTDLADIGLGLFRAAALVIVPIDIFIAMVVTRAIPGLPGRVLAAMSIVFGTLFPLLAGLDSGRGRLYLDLCVLGFLLMAGWLFLERCGCAVCSTGLSGALASFFRPAAPLSANRRVLASEQG